MALNQVRGLQQAPHVTEFKYERIRTFSGFTGRWKRIETQRTRSIKKIRIKIKN